MASILSDDGEIVSTTTQGGYSNTSLDSLMKSQEAKAAADAFNKSLYSPNPKSVPISQSSLNEVQTASEDDSLWNALIEMFKNHIEKYGAISGDRETLAGLETAKSYFSKHNEDKKLAESGNKEAADRIISRTRDKIAFAEAILPKLESSDDPDLKKIAEIMRNNSEIMLGAVNENRLLTDKEKQTINARGPEYSNAVRSYLDKHPDPNNNLLIEAISENKENPYVKQSGLAIMLEGMKRHHQAASTIQKSNGEMMEHLGNHGGNEAPLMRRTTWDSNPEGSANTRFYTNIEEFGKQGNDVLDFRGTIQRIPHPTSTPPNGSNRGRS